MFFLSRAASRVGTPSRRSGSPVLSGASSSSSACTNGGEIATTEAIWPPDQLVPGARLNNGHGAQANNSSVQARAMFSLAYGLWKYIFNKMEFCVLILGVDKSGKTTLLEKLKSIYLKGEGLSPDHIVPTVGLNIGRIEDANAKLIFWDLGGQVGLRTIWEKYYQEAHAIIYVIDAAAVSSFEDAKSALEKVLRHEDLKGAPLLIFANKQDLPGAIADEELTRHLHLKELDERPYMFQAVSAYDGRGIKSGIDWLVEQMERSKRTEALRACASVAGKI